MTTNYEPYFKVMKQVAAERGGTYSHGTTWAAIDRTRDGERVMVEVAMYEAEDLSIYWVGSAYEHYEDGSIEIATDPTTKTPQDAHIGATTAELMRFVEKWV